MQSENHEFCIINPFMHEGYNNNIKEFVKKLKFAIFKEIKIAKIDQ